VIAPNICKKIVLCCTKLKNPNQKLNAARAASTATVIDTSRCDAAPLAGRVAGPAGALYDAVRVASLDPAAAVAATVAVWLKSE
jgi:hypothetical protein